MIMSNAHGIGNGKFDFQPTNPETIEKTCTEIKEKCKIAVPEIRCAGRCDIELGDVTKHNVMVCVICTLY
jgi:hypothetical protein